MVFFVSLQNDDKNHLPATNIDDVTISIVEDEIDNYSSKHAKQTQEHNQEPAKERSPREPVVGKKDKEKIAPEKPGEHRRVQENSIRDTTHKSADITRGDNSHKKHEPHPGREIGNSTKSVSPVSDKNERNDSHTQRGSQSSQIANKPREPKHDAYPANRPREPKPEPRDIRERSLSPPDHLNKPVNPVGRTGSFIKNRDSPRRQSREVRDLDTASLGHSGEPHNPGGTPPGTLSDLKKQRSENHKLGNGLDAQVQNLFLHSLSGAGNKYSSGSGNPPQTQNRKENTQNGRNVKHNNNNTSGPTRPPTFISDSGPLRRFSAPTSHPVIGEDDKFKNNCCVIL